VTQPETPNLYDVAVCKHALIHGRAADPRAVEATQVADKVLGLCGRNADNCRVIPRNCPSTIGQNDVIRLGAADHKDVGVRKDVVLREVAAFVHFR
jgi:hypothetical protein